MTPRTRPRPAASPAARAAVTAVAVLCLAAPGGLAVASESGGARGADTTRPGDAVTLTASGTTVGVRAECASDAGDGAVFSPAFTRPAALRPAPGGGAMVAEAAVRRGLTPGHGYVVTVNCSDTESLTTTFVTGGAPRAVTGPVLARGEPVGGPVDGVTLGFGGGLAGAALAGYVLTARRTGSRRRLRTFTRRR